MGWLVALSGSVGVLSTTGAPQSVEPPWEKVTFPVGNGAPVWPAGAGTVAVNVTGALTEVEVVDADRPTAVAVLPTLSVIVTEPLTVKLLSPL